MFITFEGGEGSGKTSQINRLSDFLGQYKVRVVTTREPGGVPEAESIRSLLVNNDGGNWSAEAETLLVMAARSMHVSHLIKPALEDGKAVICDRFTDSTLAYQGYGHGYDFDKIHALNDLVLADLRPDLTFILDIDAQAGIERSTRRLSSEPVASARNEDRFEKLDLSFHERLRKGFLEIAKSDTKRYHVIDATLSMDEVTRIIHATVKDAMGL